MIRLSAPTCTRPRRGAVEQVEGPLPGPDVARYEGLAMGSASLDQLAEEAARVAQVPTSVISLMSATTQRTVAVVGTEVSLLCRADSMCGAIMDEGRPVHVEDASLDERWIRNRFVDGRWGNIRFYGAHPLVSPGGVVIGTLCVLDHRPRRLTPAQVEALDGLALRAVDILESLRSSALARR